MRKQLPREGLDGPLLVAVAGSTAAVPRLICHLRACLAHRGLGEGNILLIPCQAKEAEKLARQLEEEWTSRWLAWYTAAKRP